MASMRTGADHMKSAVTVEVLFTEAALLPIDDRARLADMLFSSLNGLPLSPAWALEIDRRVAAYDRGEIKSIPGEQVIDALKEKYGR